MKKILLVLFATLFICSLGSAQVFQNFEIDAGGFANNGWGAGLTSCTRIADPTGRGLGVLQMSFDGTAGGSGLCEVDNIDAKKVPIITCWVYLPASIPDSIQINLWAQDNNHWASVEPINIAKNIPKETWYPITINLDQFCLSTPSTFDSHTYNLSRLGIEINRWNESDADANWAGNILIDDFSFTGVQPTIFANFEIDAGGFTNNGWGAGLTSCTQVADPTGRGVGVLKMSFDGTAGGSGLSEVDNIDAKKAPIITCWVYLPASIPDSIEIDMWAQDNNSWSTVETKNLAKNIPKTTWYPITINLDQFCLSTPSTFNSHTYNLSRLGIEINRWNESDADANWAGDVLVDDFSFMGLEVGQKWVIADFEAEAGGVMGFVIPGFGAAGTSLARVKPASNGYMALNINPTLGSPVGQWAIQKSDISILDTVDKSPTTDSLIDAIGIDILVPADYNASTIGIIFQPAGNGWSWLEKDISVKDSVGCVAPGKWSTIKWPISEFKSQIVSAKLKGSFFLQSTVTGSTPFEIDLDNLTLFGIPQPAGTNLSPALTLTKDTTLAPGTNTVVDFVKFTWIDNTLGAEKYNIYMSKVGPITNLSASDVVRISTDIGHGLQSYGYRPYTSNGDSVTLYFAITSVFNGAESPLRSVCRKGPIKVKSTPTLKIQYVKDFAASFVLDGTDDEFVPYKSHLIKPQSAGGPEAWSPTVEADTLDTNFRITMIIDDHYLYISADVDDDDINTVSTYQTWQGDGLEFYMGLYDLRTMNAWHGKNFTNANGDVRIGWNTLNQMTTDGSAVKAWPGVTYALYQKLFGTSGYIVEARLTLDSLAAGNAFGAVTNGLLFPLKIDLNDIDPVVDHDSSRSQILQVGNNPFGTKTDLDQEWVRPHTWGIAEVIGGPTAVKTSPTSPYEYKLFENYPNPFNPSTTIQYTLKEKGNTILKVFNLLGQEVAMLVNEDQAVGSHSVTFNANRLSSGVYFYTIESGTFRQSKKMLLLK